ncbi:hypothetical protein JW868_03870 [Candidatus Woesearchaeota archaeon]|nr:hypothetical protein [Candidatus Woesearchaeota archaeon]
MSKRGFWDSRKGFVYTVISIFFVVIVIFLGVFYAQYDFIDSQKLKESRVRSVNNFVKSFYYDGDRAIYIASFRTLIGLEEYVSQKGVYLDDVEEAFKEVFYYGNFSGTNFEIMNDSSFREYEQRVNALANEFNLNFSTNVTDIRLTQLSPWDLTVFVDVHFILNDTKDIVDWEEDYTFNTTVPIFDLKDPFYSVETLGKLTNTLRITNITTFVNDVGDANDTTGLQTHLNESFYTTSADGPSFLMRFEGNFSTDPEGNGIESMVNLRILGDQGEPIGTNIKSVIDYIYFSEVNTTRWCNIQNMEFVPDWFMLDTGHVGIYQINGTLEYSDACG